MRAKISLAWGASHMKVGELRTIERRTYFEASREWLANLLQLDPGRPPVPQPVEVPRGDVHVPLLGMIGDSIPEGWGLKVLHARARGLGRNPATLLPEELLCLVGSGGSGALVFAPATDPGDDLKPASLEALYSASMDLVSGEASEVISALGRAAGGSGGARPKVSIDLLPDGSAVGHGGPRDKNARTYLVKFPTHDDGADYGSVELAYAEMAKAAGITMPPTRAFDIQGGAVRCFGVERFDRPHEGDRPHVISLAGALEANFRRDLTTYESYLGMTFRMAPDRDQVIEAYRRMVFNVLALVRDDHMKNFAFLLPPNGEWGLAPAFDLVPTLDGMHATTVADLSLNIPREATRHALAGIMLVPDATLRRVEEEVMSGVSRWINAAKTYGVTTQRARRVQEALDVVWRAFNGERAPPTVGFGR